MVSSQDPGCCFQTGPRVREGRLVESPGSGRELQRVNGSSEHGSACEGTVARGRAMQKLFSICHGHCTLYPKKKSGFSYFLTKI